MIERLLSHLYRSFGKEPEDRIALRVRHPDIFVWEVSGRRLRASTAAGDTLADLDLRIIDMNGVADALEAAGCQIVYRDLELAGRVADTLIAGAGREDTSNGDALRCYTSLLWALLDTFSASLEVADQTTKDALRQAYMHTAEGAWLDYWGGHYGIPRTNHVQAGGIIGDIETDPQYLLRIVREVLRPRVNAIAIEEAILELAGENVTLYEPWRQMFVLSKSELSGIDHIHDGRYWTWNVIQPIMYGEAGARDWDRIMAVIERNRPIGTVIAGPEWYPDVMYTDVPEVEIALDFEHMEERLIQPYLGAVLGEMILSDNQFSINYPATLHTQHHFIPIATEVDQNTGWFGRWNNRQWDSVLGHLIGAGIVAFSFETTS